VKNKRVIIGGAVVLLAALVLAYFSIMGSTYYYNVSDLLSHEPPLTDQTLRVSGTLLPDPVKEGLTLHFTIQDVTTDDTLSVIYNGSVPKTFKVGERLVIEGQYDAINSIFIGSNLIVKCSSKYKPAT